MSIRPTDMQVFIPKVSEVSRVQQIQNQNEQNAQQQFASQFQKEAAKQENMVQQSPKGIGTKVNKDSSKQPKKEDDEQKKEKKDKEITDEVLKDPKLGNKLDIKI